MGIYGLELHGFTSQRNVSSGQQKIDQQVEIYQTKTRDRFPDWLENQGKPLNLNSPKQLKVALSSKAIEVNSTKREVLERHSHHPVIAELLEYKKWRSQQSKYGNKVLDSVHPRTSRIHANYHQIGTETGRLSCSNPPLQQMPKQPEVRRCFIPDDKNCLIIADYSQIELRVAAQLSKDQRMIEAYQKDEDLHRLTASLLADTQITEVTNQQRQAAKAVNFGLLFAMGAKSLRDYARNNYQVEISIDQAQRFKDRFFSSYQGFANYFQRVKAQQTNKLRTLSGRLRPYQEGFAPLTQALNTPIQGTAADIIKRALADLSTKLDKTRAQIVACLHDEIIIEVDKKKAETAKQILVQVMVSSGQHYLTDVPVVVKAKVANSWAGK